MSHSHTYLTVGFFTNEGAVMTNGSSGKLAKGQFGIIDNDPNLVSALGQKVTSTISTAPGKTFQLAMGAPDLAPSKFRTNQSFKSKAFKLSDIVDISVSAPKIGNSVDKWFFGYNGKAGSEIIMKNGDTEIIDIMLEGEAIGMLGYKDSRVIVKMILKAPNEGSFTMHEIVEDAVKRFNKELLLGQTPITEYVKVVPINSENTSALVGVDYTFFHLTVSDEGRMSDRALVQAQYPLHDVKQTDYRDGKSTYTILAPAGTVLANYVKTFTSIADANCDGTPEITNSNVSIAWVTGKTCKATTEDYTIQLADDECGNNKLAALQAHYPNLNILVDTPQQTQTVTLTGTSGTGNIVIDGINYNVAFTTDLNTSASNFDTAHSTALTALGIDVTVAGAVLTFTANSGNFPLISFANTSGTLGATLGTIVGSGTPNEFLCQTVYRTRVFTNIVCEDCDPMFRDIFVSEKPSAFGFTDWDEEVKVYSETAKMGIYFEGKEAIFSGTEEFRGEIPYIYSSTRVSVANHAPGTVNESYSVGTNGRFVLKNKSIASEPSGLGKDLWAFEEWSRQYLSGIPTHKGNNYAKWALGEESMLKPLNYYVEYSVKVRVKSLSQSFNGELVENFDYKIVAEVGKHAQVEAYVNALATAAGKPTVSAY